MSTKDAVQDEQRRKWMLLGAAAAVVGGWGCATYRDVSPPYLGEPVLADQIVAWGVPNQSLSEKLGSNAVVALQGKRNTYWLVQGGDSLLWWAKRYPNSWRLGQDSKSLYFTGDQVWGKVVSVHNGVEKDAALIDIRGFVLPAIDLSEVHVGTPMPLLFRRPQAGQSPAVSRMAVPTALRVDEHPQIPGAYAGLPIVVLAGVR